MSAPSFLNPEPRTLNPEPHLPRPTFSASDLQAAFRRRPDLFAQLIRELKNLPDRVLLRIVRVVRGGDWRKAAP